MPLLLNQSQKGSYRDDRRRNDRHDQLWMDCGPYGSGPKHGTYRRRSADFRSFIISIDAFSKGAGGYSNNWPAFLFQRRVADRLQVRLSAHADALREAFLGTLAPLFRASDSPIAIACFLLVTFFPDRPLFNVPCFRSCIAFSTFSDAFLPYRATLDLLSRRCVSP